MRAAEMTVGLVTPAAGKIRSTMIHSNGMVEMMSIVKYGDLRGGRRAHAKSNALAPPHISHLPTRARASGSCIGCSEVRRCVRQRPGVGAAKPPLQSPLILILILPQAHRT